MPIKDKSVLDNVIYLDIETTGLDEFNSEIIEIGAVKIKNGEVTTFSTLIRPRGEVPTSIYELCSGLDWEQLKKAPRIEAVSGEIVTFLEDLVLICHNGDFERRFLRCHLPQIKNTILDSMELTSILEPWRREYNLESLLSDITTIKKKEAHRGLEDSFDTMKAVNALLCRLWTREEEESSKRKKSITLYSLLVKDFNLYSRWGWTKFIERPPFFSFEGFEYVSYELIKKNTLKLKPMKINYEEYEELLENTEIWNNGGDFGYQYRESQKNFTKRIRENFEKKERIFIEAPTGSGKTFAYVLIAALEGYVNKKNRNFQDASFIISTDTKELQNQLINRDIPNILRKLGLENKLNFGAVKGKSNYLCANRLKDFHEYDMDLKGTLAQVFLNRLNSTGEYGDIENISYWAFKHFSLGKYLSFVTCDSEDCNLDRCIKPCYLRKRYNELPTENITVVNHSLLASWPYAEKKKINHLIIDEAHNLMEKCYDFFSEEVKSDELLELISLIYNVEPTIYKQLRNLNMKNGLKENVELDKLKYWISEIEMSTSIIIRNLITMRVCKEYNFKSEFFLPKEEMSENIRSLEPGICHLKDSVYGIYQLIDRYFKSITSEMEDGMDDKEYRNILRYITKLKEAYEIIEKFLDNPEKKEYAKVLEVSVDYSYFKLTNVPLYIDKLVNENILKEVESTAFLSATMRINNSFDKIKRHLGQVEAKHLIVAPTFKLKQRTKIFIPDNIGPYNSIDFAEKAAKFIFEASQKLNGHILVLFNNNNRRNMVEQFLKDLIVGTRMEIHTNKKAINYLKDSNRQVIILGSKGFFEGIDVPGDALSCVMLDKLPNKSLDDPLLKAITTYKKQYYKQENYPQLCIKVKQAYGRLIRSVMDYGYFVILDGGNNSQTLSSLENDLNGPNITKCNSNQILDNMDSDYRIWKIENLKAIANATKIKGQINDNIINAESQKHNLFWKVEKSGGNILYKNLDITLEKKK